MSGRNNMFIDGARARSMGLDPPAPPANAPVLRPGYGGGLPYPEPGAVTTGGACAAERVQLAGGALNTLMVHPFITPFEQLYRRLPEEGMFEPSVSPTRPFAFELGAFTVPDRFALLLFDLRPDIYRLSGLDAGDFVPVEARRFASIMGFEVTVDQRHPGNIKYELDPIAIQSTSQAFTTVARPGGVTGIGAGILDLPVAPPPPSVFNIAAANSFGNAAGAGTALQPQRPTRYGPLSVPFMLAARSKQTVQVRCVIFRPVPAPIAFIEYDIGGMLVPTEWFDAMMECLKPVDSRAR